MRLLVSVVLAVAFVCFPSALRAQTPAGQPACDGVLVAIRISDIRPDSSVERFMAAIEAQKAWYASHGYKDDRIFVSQILVRTMDTKNFTASGKQVMTYHYYSQASQKSPVHDAAWDAFVKMFADSSVIKESILNCVPRDMAPRGR
jgi:nicotinic acid phosphoribosyltransferase